MSTGKEQLLEFWTKSVRLASAIALVAAIGLWMGFERNGRVLALGLLLGAITGVLRFRVTLRTLLAGHGPGAMVRARMIGYVMSALALLIAYLLWGRISLWTTAVGLIVMNASLVVNELLDRRKSTPEEDNSER